MSANQLGAVLATYRARLVDGPVLVLPLAHKQVAFNPNELEPLEPLGTVYSTIRVSSDWGILTVTGGALMNSDWTAIAVPKPADPSNRPLRGDGWNLELAPNWVVVQGPRVGDSTLGQTGTK